MPSTQPLAAYRPKLDQTPWGPKINIDDAYDKVPVVQAEIEAMGVPSAVAEFAANAFIWNAGHILCEDLMSMKASLALSRWMAVKSQARAA